MRAREFIFEGGWDSTVTQGTVITPAVVKTALVQIKKLFSGLNSHLASRNIPPVRVGALTGSTSYYEVDPPDKEYGDIDLQIVVPELPELESKTSSQVTAFWYSIITDYIKSHNLPYIHQASEPGHPIVLAGPDKWVQVDLMPHPEPLEKWGRYRVTPEHNVKGMLMGNMFSVLGQLLHMSIQHHGVQFKVRDNVKQPYTTTRKDYELVTLSTDIETFVKDIFDHEAELQGIRKPKIDRLLLQNPGVKTDQSPRIATLVDAVKGLARSFEINGMYKKGDLAPYENADHFINSFKEIYIGKAEKDINSAKRSKAETPEAKARAESDRKKITQGLEMVLGLF